MTAEDRSRCADYVAHPMRYHPGWTVDVPTGATYEDSYGDEQPIMHNFKLWRPAGTRPTWQAAWNDEDGERGDCQQGATADDAMQLAFASYSLDVADVARVKAAFRKATRFDGYPATAGNE